MMTSADKVAARLFVGPSRWVGQNHDDVILECPPIDLMENQTYF